MASNPPSNTVVYRFGVVGNRGKIAQLELSRPTVVAGIKGVIVQIATSNSDGYALSSNGTVWAWGVNSYGELGDGQLTPYETKAVKVDFPVGVKITALANPMPFDAGLAIDSNGHAWGWGLNGNNDLCLSTLIEARPQQLPLSDVTLVTGARTHALFDSNGVLYACGSGDAGELGNGSTTRPAPRPPSSGSRAGPRSPLSPHRGRAPAHCSPTATTTTGATTRQASSASAPPPTAQRPPRSTFPARSSRCPKAAAGRTTDRPSLS